MTQKLNKRNRSFLNFQLISESMIVILCHIKIDLITIPLRNLLVSKKILYLLVLYYYCLIIATPIVANEHTKFVLRIDEKFMNIFNYNKRNANILNDSLKIAYENYRKLTGFRVLKRQVNDALDIPNEPQEYESDEFFKDELFTSNTSGNGIHVGASCEENCNSKLLHVKCDPISKICRCENNYPVVLGLFKGCGKPKHLGEQCFYHQTCIYNDENSLCAQVSHNAICQCAPGYHSVAYTKPSKRVFCTEDLAAITSDLPTLLGVTTGIAVLAGLICMVLHLFSKTKYPRHRNMADASFGPPIMYSSDAGNSLAAQSGRPSSPSSLNSNGSIGSYGSRRPSSAPQPGSKGVIVSMSRTGAARSAAILLISCHISATNDNKLDGNYDYMTKHLQKQLKYQRELLNLEFPSLKRNSKKFKNIFGVNEVEIKEDEMNSGHITIGALPTPASETARFAVKRVSNNRDSKLSVKRSFSHSNGCMYIVWK